MASGAEQDLIRIWGDAIPVGSMRVLDLRGEEAMNQPFRFELLVESDRADWDLGELLRADCRVELGHGVLLPDGGTAGVQMLPFHGVLAEIEQRQQVDDRFQYHLVLVPKLWRLSLSFRSRIFLNKSLADIVKQVLEEGGVADSAFRLTGTYPMLPFLAQHQESDLAFVQRLCEREGIALFFEHGDSVSTLVLSDHRDGHPVVPADSRVAYRPSASEWGEDGTWTGSWFSDPVVRTFLCKQQALTGKVVIRDYQPRTPERDLTKDAAVDAPAVFGQRYEFGGDLADPDSSKRYATLRAEELACTALVASGLGSSRAFRVGATWELEEHFRPDRNAKYLLTRVQHRARRHDDGYAYGNAFTAISAYTVFRPPRITPVPRIAGTVPARVDDATDGQYPSLEKDGSYHVRYFHDLEQRDDGRASAPVRMAQAHGGQDWGLHLPLHKGAEVALGFEMGDPNLPVILGALHNPSTPSRVTSANQTQCVLTTSAGNGLRIENLKDGESVHWQAVRDHSLNAGRNDSTSVGADSSLSVGGDRSETVDKNRRTEIKADDTTSIGGKRTAEVAGDSDETIGGNVSTSIGGNRTQTIGKDTAANIGGDQSCTVGGSSETTIGVNGDITVGAALAITAGGTGKLHSGADLELKSDANAILKAGANIDLSGIKIAIDGMGGIVLSSSACKISIGPASISIEAPMISINGTGMVDIKGGLIKQNA
jgi:type VI secretion system secreted protein VgrG